VEPAAAAVGAVEFAGDVVAFVGDVDFVAAIRHKIGS
jgi:hypothetical protein